jgi:hypothetical protein
VPHDGPDEGCRCRAPKRVGPVSQEDAEAKPLLSGYQGLKQRAATTPAEDQVRLNEALQRLMQLYEEWGKKDAAATWRQELEATQPRPKGAGP